MKNTGSLQKYIPATCGVELGVERVESAANPKQFAMMMAFDLAFYGADRNLGNVLVDEESGDLFLIDHSILLSEGYRDNMGCFWGASSAASQQFPEDVASVIMSLDPNELIEIVEEEFARAGAEMPLGHERVLRHSIAVLKAAVSLGYTPKQMLSLYRVTETESYGGESKMHLMSDKFDKQGGTDLDIYYLNELPKVLGDSRKK